jgi:hypothetical protein
MAAPRVGEQLVVQDPLEGPEQDSGQVAQLCTGSPNKLWMSISIFNLWFLVNTASRMDTDPWKQIAYGIRDEKKHGGFPYFPLSAFLCEG